MNSNFVVRKATVKDIPEMVRLRRLMFEWMNYTDSDVLDKTDQANYDYFQKAIPSGLFYGWIVEFPSSKIVATGGLVIDSHPPGPTNPSGKVGYIMNMSVEPEFRNRGIAKEIFKAILLFVKENNIVVSSLHATEMGRKLYEKFGFQPTNEMRANLSSFTNEQISKL